MIIYNKVWLDNLSIRADVEKAHKRGAIDEDELKKIQEKYPAGFYTPNIFIRIGLFVLSCIIILCSGALVSFMLIDLHIVDTWGYFLFLGIIAYIALEVVVKNNHHFKSGVDDALMWISAGLLLAAFIIAQPYTSRFPYALTSLFLFLLALYYSLRFADRLMTAVCLLSFIAFVFFAWKTFSGLAMMTMPFLMMSVGTGIYFLSKRYIKKKPSRFHTGCLMIIQVISLLLLYFAGNYYVVQTLGESVQNQYTNDKFPEILLASFFWTWTILLPFIYIFFGIRKKDVTLLRSGLLLIAAAAFTFRNYYHLMPIEGTLTIIGFILLGFSYGVMRYLKTPKHGFTYEDMEEGHLMDKLKVESLIISETFSDTQPQIESTRLGGGNFGGGGSSSNF